MLLHLQWGVGRGERHESYKLALKRDEQASYRTYSCSSLFDERGSGEGRQGTGAGSRASRRNGPGARRAGLRRPPESIRGVGEGGWRRRPPVMLFGGAAASL
jgi:hypothetical protein